MRLSWEVEPIVGQPFHFSVDRPVGTASGEISIDRKVVLKFDCEDPPCHEVFIVPSGTAGSVLVLTVRDARDTERVEFVIRDLEAGRATESAELGA